jgi:hypothetical protein
MIPVFLLSALLPSEAALASPAPVPLFVKSGFSSVLEFDAKPSRVVIGDGGSFQVERLDRSLVIRPTVDEATTNLFVYFPNGSTRMFLLRATMEEEPALFRKYGVEATVAQQKIKTSVGFKRKATRILSANIDAKKDYLTVEAELSAPPNGKLEPVWKSVRLKAKGLEEVPQKLWAERGEIQADSTIKARFVFRKPNLLRSLKETSLVIPLKGRGTALVLRLGGVQ